MTAPLMLYNTETRTKVPFTAHQSPVKMYTCGPTVYHYAHIGNFRTYIFEDLLRRTLKLFGFEVEQVMNLTDVDDKTIKGALREHLSLDDYTRPFKEAFFEDLRTLHIESVEHYPAATDFLPQMIALIQTLLRKELAYCRDGSVYYSIRKFPRYGRLAQLSLEQLRAGASERVALDEYDKDNVSDFVLWKAYDPQRDGTMYWESPFGKGRPGWHLECSAMAMHLLGDQIDIHCGGVDNMFPHHENEIAQSEGCTDKQFVRHWMHSEHLIVDGKKMSKSLGNFYTLRDLLQRGFTGPQVRYMLLHTHYRMQLNFSFDELAAVGHSLDRLNGLIIRLHEAEGGVGGSLASLSHAAFEQFKAALGDDLNISAALAAVFDYVRAVNVALDANQVSKEEAQEVLQVLRRIDGVLGVMNFEIEGIPAGLQVLMRRREEARRSKRWGEADAFRDELLHQGYLVEDTPLGPRLKKR